jgi:hypothetical protein
MNIRMDGNSGARLYYPLAMEYGLIEVTAKVSGISGVVSAFYVSPGLLLAVVPASLLLLLLMMSTLSTQPTLLCQSCQQSQQCQQYYVHLGFLCCASACK